MTNNTIICNEAIAHGVYTQAEIEEFIELGQLPPLHTYAEWKSLGYQVKKGEHACITTRLWQLVQPKADQNGDEEEGLYFVLVKAHLFDESQVERMEVIQA